MRVEFSARTRIPTLKKPKPRVFVNPFRKTLAFTAGKSWGSANWETELYRSKGELATVWISIGHGGSACFYREGRQCSVTPARRSPFSCVAAATLVGILPIRSRVLRCFSFPWHSGVFWRLMPFRLRPDMVIIPTWRVFPGPGLGINGGLPTMTGFWVGIGM